MIRDLIKRPKKTEHKTIWQLRRVVIIILLMILVASFVIMSIRIYKENPTISTAFTSLDSVPAPSVFLSFAHNFTITCWVYFDYSGKKANSCNEYVTQPQSTGDIDYPYGGIFSPKEIKLTRYDDIGPYFVYLDLNITDPTYSDLSEDFFRMNLYDSDDNDYNILDIQNMNNMQSGSKMTPFEESLFYINKHTLNGGYLHKLGFSRNIRKSIGQPILSYIGFPSKYRLKPYIESNIQSVPVKSFVSTYLSVRISPRNFISQEEQEQRNDTLIGALGIIAAYYSSIVFIYVFLFGVDSMKPWGVIHNRCCGLKRFSSDTEEMLAWVSSPSTDDIYKRVEVLEKFKDFLSSNVVDTSLLLKRGKKIGKKGRRKSRRGGGGNNGSSEDMLNDDRNSSSESSNNSINDDSRNNTMVEINMIGQAI